MVDFQECSPDFLALLSFLSVPGLLRVQRPDGSCDEEGLHLQVSMESLHERGDSTQWGRCTLSVVVVVAPG